MRLNMVMFWHGKTTSDRPTRRQAGTGDRRHFHIGRDPATMSGSSSAGRVRGYTGTNRERSWRGPCDCGSTPSRLSQEDAGVVKTGGQLGGTPPGSSDPGGGMRVLETLVGKGRRRPLGGRFSNSSRPRATPGPTDQAVGGLPAFSPAWVAQDRARHPASQEQARGSLPEVLATLLTRKDVKGRHVRLMFQDEARFGRMVRIRRCWAPAPQRPVVANGYAREFQYVYGAVSPMEGELDWVICPAMNTQQMGKFLAQVSAAHARDFIVMVIDGASSHVSKDLMVPENIRLHRLPGYSPELNPQEHLWDEIGEKEFPNRVFSDMSGVMRTLRTGLPRLASDRDRLRSICAWPWIISLNLKAH